MFQGLPGVPQRLMVFPSSFHKEFAVSKSKSPYGGAGVLAAVEAVGVLER